MKRDRLVLSLAQLWILALIVGSLQPARPAPVVSMHRAIHCVAFACAAFLLFLLARNFYQEIQAAVATCLLGLSLEWVQHLLYRNSMEWHDVRDDALAVLASFTLYRLGVLLKRLAAPRVSLPEPAPAREQASFPH